MFQVLMCQCHYQQLIEFNDEAVQNVSENFDCGCKENHRCFVLRCRFHPFIGVSYWKDCCTCKVRGKCCDFYFNVADILNYKAFKVFVKKIPAEVNRQRLVPLGRSYVIKLFLAVIFIMRIFG